MSWIDLNVPRDLRDLDAPAVLEKILALRLKLERQIDKRKEVTPLGFSLEELVENEGLNAQLNYVRGLEQALLVKTGRG